MSCVLSIIGRNFDVDAFIELSKLKRYKVFYKGDDRSPVRPERGKLTASGISIVASRAGFDDLKTQIADTVRYLKRNRDKLGHIAGFKGIEHAVLDFGLNLERDGKPFVFTRSYYFPAHLVQLAGSLGIGIECSVYAGSSD